jgi:hypothetical protein
MSPKRTVGIVVGFVGLVLVSLILLSGVHPTSVPKRNEITVVTLLRTVRVELQRGTVTAATFQNGVVLRPGQPRALAGYLFTLRTHGSGFSVDAVPERYGLTGFDSLFVDETGVIRSALRKPATGESPPIEHPVP